ncbi:MAG: S-layer homology domain-containing protein [Clostridia bacterium]|jgi:hypothetical protein|nr:S-layer homology domain-containing protein [Clostridia bacterium]
MKKMLIVLTICLALINSDANAAEYKGRIDGQSIVDTIDFNDVPREYWASEAIIRAGALDMVKGYNNEFRPLDGITNEEALAFIMRGLGYEDRAIELGIEYRNVYPDDSLEKVWSVGYIVLAEEQGIITGENLGDALRLDQENLDANAFARKNIVDRETVAVWLVKLLGDKLEPVSGYHQIFEFDDWKNIDEDNLMFIEKAVANGIISGDGKSFNPDKLITRAEMAQMLKNIEKYYNEEAKIEKKSGYINRIEDILSEEGKTRKFYITSDEVEDVITVTKTKFAKEDLVVYRNNRVENSGVIEELESIGYLVDSDGRVLYIFDKGESLSKVMGRMIPTEEEGILVVERDGNLYEYKLDTNMYRTKDTGKELRFDGNFMKDEALPYYKNVEVIMTGSVVVDIKKGKDEVVDKEIKGVVIDNNPMLSYITIYTEDGEITKSYERNKVKVEKQEYTDEEDEMGYIDEVFPNFAYDPRDTKVENIEAGDIVYLRMDGDLITNISAKTDYSVKYAKVTNIENKGKTTYIYVTYEDGTNERLTASKGVYVSKGGYKVNLSEILDGDWLKILVNEAVIEEANVIKSVKEIVIDDDNKIIKNIYRGEFSHLNHLQGKVVLKDAEKYTKSSWTDYQNMIEINLSNEVVPVFVDGLKVSLEYAENKLYNFDGYVYVATEKYYDKEIVKKVTFSSEREYTLKTDEVVYADGKGNFKLDYKSTLLTADDSTIVRRYGRMVDNISVKDGDYAKVVMSGDKAALIDIFSKADTSNIDIYRARVKDIETGSRFEVESFSELDDMDWDYSTVDKIFNMDKDIVIYEGGNVLSRDKFIDYTEDSKVGEIYTIATDGTDTLVISDMPYTKEAVKGEVYKIDGSTIYTKDSYVYRRSISKWQETSIKDTSVFIEIEKNAIIVKDNKIIDISEIDEGDKVRIYTNVNYKTKSDSEDIKGYIVLVEG